MTYPEKLQHTQAHKAGLDKSPKKEATVMSTTAYQIIAVDFDGTLCYSNWPELGEPNRPLIEYLINQKRSGNKLILWVPAEPF